MPEETEKKEILSAIEKLSKRTEESIGELHEAIGEFSNRVDERFEKMESRMDSMESRMVTKEYLDEKLFDLRGDFFELAKKEDSKVELLINILRRKNVLDKNDSKSILRIKLFPKAI